MSKKVYEDKWLIIYEEKPKPKTKVFDVWSKCSRISMGEIKWYAPWRHYCHIISHEIMIGEEALIFSDRCQEVIWNFTKKLNKEHKETKQ